MQAEARAPVLAALHQFNDGLVRRLRARALRDARLAARRLPPAQGPPSIARVSPAARGLWTRRARPRRRGWAGSKIRPTADCSMFTSGRWRSITPLSGPRRSTCSAIVEDEDGQPEMWVMGGYAGGGEYLATVEAYNPRTNTWRSCLPLSQSRSCRRRRRRWPPGRRGRLCWLVAPSHQSRPTLRPGGPAPASAARSQTSHGVRAERAALRDGRLALQQAAGAGDVRGK